MTKLVANEGIIKNPMLRPISFDIALGGILTVKTKTSMLRRILMRNVAAARTCPLNRTGVGLVVLLSAFHGALFLIAALTLAGCGDSSTKPKEKWGPEWAFSPSGHRDGSIYFVRARGGLYQYGTYRTFVDSSALELAFEYGDPPKISPCGDVLAVVGADGALWTTAVHPDSGFGPTQLIYNPRGGSISSFCWQGCEALIFSDQTDSVLFRIKLATLTIDTLAPFGIRPSASLDGSIVVFQRYFAFFEWKDGVVRKLFEISHDSASWDSELSPDGRYLLYDYGRLLGGGWVEAALISYNIREGTSELVRELAQQPTWVSDSVIAFVRMRPYAVEESNQIWVMNLRSGEARAVTTIEQLGF